MGSGALMMAWLTWDVSEEGLKIFVLCDERNFRAVNGRVEGQVLLSSCRVNHFCLNVVDLRITGDVLHWIGVIVDDLHALQNIFSLYGVRLFTGREVQVVDNVGLIVLGLYCKAPQYCSAQGQSKQRGYAGAYSTSHC